MSSDALFYAQLSISLFGMAFTGTLLVLQPDQVNIYLPIFTSLLFAWIPSPISSKSIQTQLETIQTKVSSTQQQQEKQQIATTTSTVV